MSDEEEQKCDCPPGLPAWLATFADLMSLLMCFFVLLLSFSEMDVLKFKRLAGSMREAFGVQNQIKANDIPKGTSIIAQEFSPGKPEPTPLQVVMQHTVDADQVSLDVLCESKVEKAVQEACPDGTQTQKDNKNLLNEFIASKVREATNTAEEKAMEVAAKMEKEVAQGMVEVEVRGQKIVIRIEEKGSFASGSAELQADFIPVLDKLIDVLESVNGDIAVEGHTDNIPISTAEFPSNWDLSVARALSVAHGLFDDGYIKQNRFTISGYADNRPIVPNDTPEHRAKNRRVEIILQEHLSEETKKVIKDAKKAIEDGATELPSEVRNFGGLKPEEIF